MSTKAQTAPATALAPRKPSSLANMANRLQADPVQLLATIKAVIMPTSKDGKTASDAEIQSFCIVADQYGLNPFTRAIHAFSDPRKGIVPIVGIDGWTKIVNARADYDGCEFDELEGHDGKPVSTTCRMHVKGRGHPVSVTERFAECYRNTPPWNQMPTRMLRHKAFMQAARYAFSLSGIYDDDEARDIIHVEGEASPPRRPVTMPTLKAAPATDAGSEAAPAAEPPAGEPLVLDPEA